MGNLPDSFTLTEESTFTVTAPDGSKVIVHKERITCNGQLQETCHSVEKISSPNNPNKTNEKWSEQYSKDEDEKKSQQNFKDKENATNESKWDETISRLKKQFSSTFSFKKSQSPLK